MITDHKNLIYFKEARIINRREIRWTLEVQNILFRLEYQKEKNNIMADIFTRREDVIEKIESRSIFLQIINIKKTKEQDYHSFMEISEIKKQDDDRWRYRRKLIMEQEKEKKQIIMRNHDDLRTGHPGFKETLRRMTEMAFWDTMRKDVFRYMQECREYQLEKENRKKGLNKEIE